jgi:hypothetical protein
VVVFHVAGWAIVNAGDSLVNVVNPAGGPEGGPVVGVVGVVLLDVVLLQDAVVIVSVITRIAAARMRRKGAASFVRERSGRYHDRVQPPANPGDA